jgi:hypothetical protein
LGLLLAALAVGLVVALVYAAVHALGIALGVIGILLFFVALVAAVSVAYPAVAYSYFAVVLENAAFVNAVSSGISRTFGRSFWRSLLTGLAGTAFLTGFSLLQTLVVGLVSALFFSVVSIARHDPSVAVITGSVAAVPIGIAGAIVITAFFEIAYFDVRVRSEGFDLERAAAADALAVPGAT